MKVFLAVYDPAYQAADGSYWTWHAPELSARLLASTYYELLVPNIPPAPNQLTVDQLWAGLGDISDEWRCYFRFVNGGRDQRGRPGRFVVLCVFVSRTNCQLCDPLELLRSEQLQKLAQQAQTECPLAAGQLQLSLQPSSIAAHPVQLAELIAAGRLRHMGIDAVQRAAQLFPGLPTDRRWQATLHDLSGEQSAEIWLQGQRSVRQLVTDGDSAGDDQVLQYASNEPEAKAASPVNNRPLQRVLVGLIAPVVVVVLAACGLLWLRLSVLQIGLAVCALGLLGLVWLLRRRNRSHG